MQIGFVGYQYAKFHIVQFYFDFMDKYPSGDDQYCDTDTDGAYIAIGGPSVESLNKPRLTAEFEKDKANWFPRTDTPENKAYERLGFLRREYT